MASKMQRETFAYEYTETQERRSYTNDVFEKGEENNNERQPLLSNTLVDIDNSHYEIHKDNRTAEESIQPGPPDGGWGWVVCFATFIETLLFDGVFYSFGMIFLELTDHFGSKKETGAWISSLNFGICMTIGPLVSALCNRFGFRTVTIVGTFLTSCGLVLSSFATSISFLCVSYGVIAGIGYGMVFSPSVLAVTLYFDKKRSLATGLALCGNGLGVFIMSPVTEWLLEKYTWRGAFIVQAALLLNGIVCGLVFRPLEPYAGKESQHKTPCPDNVFDTKKCTTQRESLTAIKKGGVEQSRTSGQEAIYIQGRKTEFERKRWFTKRQKTRFHGEIKTKNFTKEVILRIVYETFDISLLKNPPFCIYTISSALYSLAYYVPFVYIPDVARQAGIDPVKGAWLLSSIGVANIVSRVMFGLCIDRPQVNRVFIYSVSVFLVGVAIATIPLLESFEIFLSICVAFGLSAGVSIILVSVLVVDILGAKDTTNGFGILSLFSGIASIVGSPFAGWLFDLTRTFDLSFYVSGAVVSLSGAMLFIFPCLNYKQRA